MDLLFYLQLVFVVVANMLAYGRCFCSPEYDFTTMYRAYVVCRYVRSVYCRLDSDIFEGAYIQINFYPKHPPNKRKIVSVLKHSPEYTISYVGSTGQSESLSRHSSAISSAAKLEKPHFGRKIVGLTFFKNYLPPIFR